MPAEGGGVASEVCTNLAQESFSLQRVNEVHCIDVSRPKRVAWARAETASNFRENLGGNIVGRYCAAHIERDRMQKKSRVSAELFTAVGIGER